MRLTGTLACAAGALLLATAAPAQPAPSGDRFTGVLTALWGDPAGGSPGGGVAYGLVSRQGTEVAVEVPPALSAAAARLAGRRVVVMGKATAPDGRIAASAIEEARSPTD